MQKKKHLIFSIYWLKYFYIYCINEFFYIYFQNFFCQIANYQIIFALLQTKLFDHC